MKSKTGNSSHYLEIGGVSREENLESTKNSNYETLGNYRASYSNRYNPSKMKQKTSSSRKGLFAGLLAIFMLFLTGLTTASAVNTQQAEAFSFKVLCSTNMGTNMDGGESWTNFVFNRQIGMGKAPRTWSGKEAFGNAIKFVTYHGEGEGDGSAQKKDYEQWKSLYNLEDVSGKLEGARTFNTCGVGFIATAIDNLGNAFNSTLSGFAGTFVSLAFDPRLICDPNSDNKICIPLTGIIGGEPGEGEGLIGTFRDSIYFPLIVLVVPMAGLYLVFKAVRGGMNRGILGGFAFIFIAAILGVAIMSNPQLLARAPVAISNTVAGCIVGSLTGNSCTSSGGSNQEIVDSEQICAAKINADIDEQIVVAIDALSCMMWKAFVLEPWAQGSFGRSFNDLDTSNPDEELQKTLEASGLTGEDFCVPMTSDKTGNEMKGKTLELGGSDKICNIALYQLFLQTDAVSTTDKPEPSDNMEERDIRWYKIVSVTAHDETMWNNWSYHFNWNRFFTVFLASIATILGGSVLAVIAFFALVYRFIVIFLMAILPIYFLLLLWPNHGKRLMLGWLQQFISNIWSYLVSIVLLIIGVVTLGKVIGQVESFPLQFAMILIVCGAIWYFRKELISAIGRVNFGGKELGKSFSDSLGKRGKGALKLGSQTLAGTAAGAASNGVFSPFSKEGWAGLGAGALAGGKEALNRNLRNKNNFVGNALKTAERISKDNRTDLRAEGNAAKGRAKELDEKLTEDLQNNAPATQNAGKDYLENEAIDPALIDNPLTKVSAQAGNEAAANLIASGEIRHKLEATFRDGADATTAEKQAFGLFEKEGQLRDLDARILADQQLGMQTPEELLAERDKIATAIDSLNEAYTGDNEVQQALADIRTAFAQEMGDSGVADLTAQEIASAIVMSQGVNAAIDNRRATIEAELLKAEAAATQGTETLLTPEQKAMLEQLAHNEAAAEIYQRLDRDWKPGERVSDAKRRRVAKQVEARAEEIKAEKLAAMAGEDNDALQAHIDELRALQEETPDKVTDLDELLTGYGIVNPDTTEKFGDFGNDRTTGDNSGNSGDQGTGDKQPETKAPETGNPYDENGKPRTADKPDGTETGDEQKETVTEKIPVDEPTKSTHEDTKTLDRPYDQDNAPTEPLNVPDSSGDSGSDDSTQPENPYSQPAADRTVETTGKPSGKEEEPKVEDKKPDLAPETDNRPAPEVQTEPTSQPEAKPEVQPETKSEPVESTSDKAPEAPRDTSNEAPRVEPQAESVPEAKAEAPRSEPRETTESTSPNEFTETQGYREAEQKLSEAEMAELERRATEAASRKFAEQAAGNAATYAQESKAQAEAIANATLNSQEVISKLGDYMTNQSNVENLLSELQNKAPEATQEALNKVVSSAIDDYIASNKFQADTRNMIDQAPMSDGLSPKMQQEVSKLIGELRAEELSKARTPDDLSSIDNLLRESIKNSSNPQELSDNLSRAFKETPVTPTTEPSRQGSNPYAHIPVNEDTGNAGGPNKQPLKGWEDM